MFDTCVGEGAHLGGSSLILSESDNYLFFIIFSYYYPFLPLSNSSYINVTLHSSVNEFLLAVISEQSTKLED